MPKNIATQHISRMFPFEFYDELSEQLTGYVFQSPAFMLRDQVKPEHRKQLYYDTQQETVMHTLRENNIIQVEPLGELLLLEVCCSDEHADIILDPNRTEDRTHIPLSILVAQLYDSSAQPVFASNVSEDTIERIPEVLWDDPNLLLAIVTFSEKETQLGVIQIPKRIEDTIFEPVDSSQPNKEDL